MFGTHLYNFIPDLHKAQLFQLVCCFELVKKVEDFQLNKVK